MVPWSINCYIDITLAAINSTCTPLKLPTSSGWTWQWLTYRSIFLLFHAILLSREIHGRCHPSSVTVTISAWHKACVFEIPWLFWFSCNKVGNLSVPSKFAHTWKMILSLLTSMPEQFPAWNMCILSASKLYKRAHSPTLKMSLREYLAMKCSRIVPSQLSTSPEFMLFASLLTVLYTRPECF